MCRWTCSWESPEGGPKVARPPKWCGRPLVPHPAGCAGSWASAWKPVPGPPAPAVCQAAGHRPSRAWSRPTLRPRLGDCISHDGVSCGDSSTISQPIRLVPSSNSIRIHMWVCVVTLTEKPPESAGTAESCGHKPGGTKDLLYPGHLACRIGVL